MSSILNSDDFGLKIYNRFPPKYREDDVGQNYALKRYLQALSDGGFKYAIDEINGITTLIDPDKVDAKVLPVLFKQYGLDIFNGIPEEYLRYLLPKLGEAWSKKGSLSVVEFITSSLSGIKTSTEVNYDEKDNPIVNVRLEMDYNIGDYFPEAEQFTRLLENFVPFYCDVSMLYSYLFHETQVLVGKEDDYLSIIDTMNEKGFIPHDIGVRYYPQLNTEQRLLNGSLLLNESYLSESPDYHEDKIIVSPLLESVGLTRSRSTQYFKNSLNRETLNKTLILSEYLETDFNVDSIAQQFVESPKMKGLESDNSLLSLVSEESSAVRSRGVQTSETTAVLGQAVMGVAVLGDSEENADVFEDHVVNTIGESKTLIYPMGVTSYLNSSGHVLNSQFHINSGIHSYDVVTKNGVKSYILY